MPVLASIAATPTQDQYSAAATVEARGARNADITVSNAAVYMSISYETSPGISGGYGQEERVIPKLLTISDEPIAGVRFRSAVAGVPAVVDVSLST